MSDWDKGTEPDHDAETFRATFGSLTHTSQGGPLPLSQLPSLPVGMQVGDYEIDQRIGEGAMSEVFAAVHRTIGRRVAIKVLNQRLFADPEAKERFISEARAAAEIHHPNTCTFSASVISMTTARTSSWSGCAARAWARASSAAPCGTPMRSTSSYR